MLPPSGSPRLLGSSGFRPESQEKRLTATAQPATAIRHVGEVIAEKVVLTGEWGSNELAVYPSRQEFPPRAPSCLSHSAIHADTAESAEMRLFALLLARAGAAAVVPQGTLIRPPENRPANRASGDSNLPRAAAHRSPKAPECRT